MAILQDQANETVADEAATGEQVSAAEAAFERFRKRSGVVLSPLAFVVTYLLVGHYSGLPYQGRTMASVLAAVGVLWMTEALPLPVTALLGAVLCIVLGVADARTVLGPFADPFIFLFLASFILAQSMMLHGLDRRIALRFLSLPGVGASPARVMAGVGAITAFLSMWVSNTATTAMMLPIALGVLGALHHVRVTTGVARGPLDARHWPYATGMMLMVAYAASIGGIGTPVGSPPNLIGLGLIQRNAGVSISFFTWMGMMVPMLIVMAGVLFVLLYAMHPVAERAAVSRTAVAATAGPGPAVGTLTYREPGTEGGLSVYLRDEMRKLGPWTTGQFNTLIAFSVAVVLWVTPGLLAAAGREGSAVGQWFKTRMPEAAVAMVAAVLLFVLPTNLRRG